MFEGLLSGIGLNEKEVAAYLALITSGTRPTSFIAKRASLNRGTAYVALHSLLQKGLVAKTMRRKVQYFTANDPGSLTGYVGGRISDLQEKREQILIAAEQLRRIMRPAGSAPTFELFEGPDGARAALEDTLTAKEGVLRAFLSISDVQEFVGSRHFDDYTGRRINAGIALHVIRTREKDKEAMRTNALARKYTTRKSDLRVVRYVGEDLAFPVTTYVYDDKITVISSRQENFAMIIRSAELSLMQLKLFNLLWQGAE